MRKIELKPCPFCGGNAKIESIPPDEQYETTAYYISCEHCGSSTSFGYIYADKTARECTRKETVDKWNRRAGNVNETQP